jgi:nitroimidazol reductase NimA-like FMN-containing flavoprotein (pyridoxamine 5'-phosphate oxidase superfamily)
MSLNQSEIAKILEQEEIVYIATTKKGGEPHVVPIWFVCVDGKYILILSVSQI